MTTVEFSTEDYAAIRRAAEAADIQEAKAILYERFGDRGPTVHLAAVRETDELREGLRATEADERSRAAGVPITARDMSHVVESYNDGSYLMRDAPGGLTGDVIGER